MAQRGTRSRSTRPTRRAALAVAWSVPVVVVGAPAQAVAASHTVTVKILTAGAGLLGFDLYVKDGKFGGPPSTIAGFRTGSTMPVLAFQVLIDGLPAVGVGVTITPDSQTDIEHNQLVKFVSSTYPSNLGEGTPMPPYSTTTGTGGTFAVGVATATYFSTEPKPRIGTFTVTVAATATTPATTITFTYEVFDG